jgi:hypothetical protein
MRGGFATGHAALDSFQHFVADVPFRLGAPVGGAGRFANRMALARLTPQCAAAWRQVMPPSTALITLLRISSLILGGRSVLTLECDLVLLPCAPVSAARTSLSRTSISASFGASPNGRAWLDEPNEDRGPCDCGWAPELGTHYRARLLAKARG